MILDNLGWLVVSKMSEDEGLVKNKFIEDDGQMRKGILINGKVGIV